MCIRDRLYAVLSQGFRAQKTEGNLNNEIGLPLTLMRMTRDTEVLVAEMGMNHFGAVSYTHLFFVFFAVPAQREFCAAFLGTG